MVSRTTEGWGREEEAQARVKVNGRGQTLQRGWDTGTFEGIRRMGWKEDGAEDKMEVTGD